MKYAGPVLFAGVFFGFLFNLYMPILITALIIVCILRFFYSKSNIWILVFMFIFGIFLYTRASNIDSKIETFIGKNVTVICRIIDEPVQYEDLSKFIAKCDSIVFRDKEYKLNCSVLIYDKGGKNFHYGEVISVHGKIEEIISSRNPGDFNYKLYWKSKNVYAKITSSSITCIKKTGLSNFHMALYRCKSKIRENTIKAMPKNEAGILYGIITGDKSHIEDDMRENYMKAGIAHILSVSGLHIGFLVLALKFLLANVNFRNDFKYIIILICVFIYILLIGAPPSALRAFIMFLVYLLSMAVNRKYNLLTSISFALMLMLIYNPFYIHNPGFVISFFCMYSLGLLYKPIYKKLIFIKAGLRGVVALPLSVQLGIIPICVHYFNYISFISIFINIIAVPLSFVITMFGFIGVIISIFSYKLSIFVFSIPYYLIKLLSFICSFVSSIKLLNLSVPTLPLYFYLLYFILLMFLVDWFDFKLYRVYKSKFILYSAIFFTIILLIYIKPSSKLHIVFFDVGQGDSSLVITPNKKAILIDGGGQNRDGKFYYNVGHNITVPAILHQGVWSIDTVFVSHAHDDHIEGLIEVCKSFKVKNIVLPKVPYESDTLSELLSLCKKGNINIIYMNKGDNINFDSGVHFNVLYPYNKLVVGSSSDENNNSLVLKLQYEEFSLLYTGDIQKEAENILMAENIDCDVLKVAHHGSKFSTQEAFLQKTSPKIALISVGKNNFGHPSDEVIGRLTKARVKTYITLDNGALTIDTNGVKMSIKSQRN